MRKLFRIASVVAGLSAVLVSGWSSRGEAVTLPPCDNFICAFDGDFTVMSMPLAGLNIKSSPGQIKDGVVIYTGAGGVNSPVVVNFAGMDDAYPAISGNTLSSFSTTTTADPGGTGDFAGDVQSWDSTMAAFLTFLNGSTPIFFFNQNETNNADPTEPDACGSQSSQDVCVYGLLTLVDAQDSDNNVTFELEAPTRLFTDGPGNTDGDPILPDEYVLAKGDVCLDANGAQQACDGSQAVGPVNHNLGADDAAYAAFSTALNAILAQCASQAGCIYDSISIRLDLADLSNGFEQLFILTSEQVSQIPAPGTLILLGVGLLGLGASTWRRRQRG